MPKKLIATYPILYESKLYKEGEPLPANNHEMTKIWLDSKTAEWKDVNENHDGSEKIEVEDEKSDELKSQAIGNIENTNIEEEKLEKVKLQEPKTKKK
ncbi:hypothetical protein [Clostridium saccharoperbutylacetonicum]